MLGYHSNRIREGLKMLSFGTIPECSVVHTTRVINVAGRTLPIGTQGAVVHVYARGEAYEVEFVHPFPAVVTLCPRDIKADARH